MMLSDHLILCHPLLLCPQSLPASESFPTNPLSTSGGQSIGASASASVLPMSVQGRFPLGLTSWISLQSKRLSRVFSSITTQKHQFFSVQPSLWYNSYIHMMTGKTTALTMLWHMLWHSYDPLIMPLYMMIYFFFFFEAGRVCNQFHFNTMNFLFPGEANLQFSQGWSSGKGLGILCLTKINPVLTTKT